MKFKMVKIRLYFHKSLWVTKYYFNFFVLKVFDYEISKRAIIHMDFIEHFSKYYDYLEIVPIKTTNVIIILFELKNRIWMFTSGWTLIYKWL